MCKWGTSESVIIGNGKAVAVDSCIAPLVRALNDAGIPTVASCCGHGKGFGDIALQDGRELVILPNYEAARAAEKILALPPAAPEREPLPVDSREGVMGGAPCLRGTRIPVEIVWDMYRGGMTPEEILAQYPHLSEALILGGLAYAAERAPVAPPPEEG